MNRQREGAGERERAGEEAATGDPAAAGQRFVCTPRGGIATGQRRLRLLLVGMAVLMVLAAVFSVTRGGWLGAGLCLLTALVAFVTWRMSGESMPLWVELAGGELLVRTRTSEPRLKIAGASARRLEERERRHLERLASLAGVVVPSGGFDSRLLGEFELYASDLAHAVLVESEESRWVLTPDDPQAFLSALGEKRGQAPH